MKLIKCKSCGSNELSEDGDYIVCAFCASRHLPQLDEARGGQSTIDLANDIQLLLDKCRSDPHNRVKYVNLILDIDPHNEDVQQFR